MAAALVSPAGAGEAAQAQTDPGAARETAPQEPAAEASAAAEPPARDPSASEPAAPAAAAGQKPSGEAPAEAGPQCGVAAMSAAGDCVIGKGNLVPREDDDVVPGATETASSSPARGGVVEEAASAAIDGDAANAPRELAADPIRKIERDAQASWQAKPYHSIVCHRLSGLSRLSYSGRPSDLGFRT